MDIDDDLVLMGRVKARIKKCKCKSEPIAPKIDFGCLCSKCGLQCKKCSGFGHVVPPTKKVNRILTHVRSNINRITNKKRHPPGFVRLTKFEIKLLLRKYHSEDNDHWIRDHIEIGPPLKIYDVIVIKDRRKE